MIIFLCNQFFPSQTLTIHTIHRTTGKRGDIHLFHSTISTSPRIFRHLFATLHVRLLSCIFNRNACVNQTASRWDLPPYWTTIWLTESWCNVCLFTWWFDSRFFVTAIWQRKPMDLNSYRLSSLCCKRTD